MKRIFLLLSIAIMAIQSNAMQVNVTANITTNTTWVDSNIYLLKGFIYVKNGATLTINPGTIIMGEKANKGTLIITKNGKINAQGTANQPIVFTTDQLPGNRNYGDWGGIVLLGKAPTNSFVVVGGTNITGIGVIEGGVNNSAGDGEYGAGAASDPEDSSGVFSYVRIEFPGIAFQPNNEINGLTLGGVGSKTKLDHIQVSYSGDDSYEWFGGTVNAKYLIAYRGWDDDFDTDNGYRGKIQYGIVLRDSAIADISGSNGFESDNDAGGTTTAPFTSPIFSNMTIVGPKQTSTTTINANYKRGMHIRRRTKMSLFNSIVMGYPTGLLLDGAGCDGYATAGDLEIKNTILAGSGNNFASVTSYNVSGWFGTSGFANDSSLSNAGVGLTSPFNYLAPNFAPTTTSPALTGASFTSSTKISDPFFDVVTYQGAVGATDWTAGWTNFNPQATQYGNQFALNVKNIDKTIKSVLYPNPTKNIATLTLQLENKSNITVQVVDITGKIVTSQYLSLYAGEHQIKMNTEQLTAGMYFIQIKNNNQISDIIKWQVSK
jgi:hypothetical protein